jgi:hypothetical protein
MNEKITLWIVNYDAIIEFELWMEKCSIIISLESEHQF